MQRPSVTRAGGGESRDLPPLRQRRQHRASTRGSDPRAGVVRAGVRHRRPGGPPGSAWSVLADRFLASESSAAHHDAAYTDLQSRLSDSGAGEDIIDAWKQAPTVQAADLVPVPAAAAASDRLREYVD